MLLIEHCNKMQAQVMMVTPEGHAETLQQGKSQSGNEDILIKYLILELYTPKWKCNGV